MGLGWPVQENQKGRHTGHLSKGWLLSLCGIHNHPGLGSKQESPNH